MARVSLKDVYSAPRRFDMASILVVSMAFSVLFGMLSFFSAAPLAYVFLSGFITLVAIGQAVLFGGKKPRLASVWVGVGFHACWILILMGNMMFSYGIRTVHGYFLRAWLLLLFGALLGYLAGGLVGGTFLVADVLRQWLSRSASEDTET